MNEKATQFRRLADPWGQPESAHHPYGSVSDLTYDGISESGMMRRDHALPTVGGGGADGAAPGRSAESHRASQNQRRIVRTDGTMASPAA